MKKPNSQDATRQQLKATNAKIAALTLRLKQLELAVLGLAKP